MDVKYVRKLSQTIFNYSKSISHVHVFGETCSGRREIIRQIFHNSKKNWVVASTDFLYADGSLKLLLESLASDLNFKTRGNRIEDFFCNMYEFVNWPDPENRRIILFLDNAQAVINFPPALIRCFLNSTKEIPEMMVRFVTSSPSCWENYHTSVPLGHFPSIQMFVKTPDAEKSIQLISECCPQIHQQFIRFAVESLAPFCKSPNILLAIITEASQCLTEANHFDVAKAKFYLKTAAQQKLGICTGGDQKPNNSNQNQDTSDCFDTMPISMRYVLISAYCASNNAPTSDRRFFVKNHGRDKRSEQQELRAEVRRQFKDFEPKAADLQRIICIYETFLTFTNRTFHGFDVKQVISSLCSMGLVTVTNPNNLDTPKIKCLLSLESARKIAGSIKIELREYLETAI